MVTYEACCDLRKLHDHATSDLDYGPYAVSKHLKHLWFHHVRPLSQVVQLAACLIYVLWKRSLNQLIRFGKR